MRRRIWRYLTEYIIEEYRHIALRERRIGLRGNGLSGGNGREDIDRVVDAEKDMEIPD